MLQGKSLFCRDDDLNDTELGQSSLLLVLAFSMKVWPQYEMFLGNITIVKVCNH